MMRIYDVKKINRITEECGADKKWLKTLWINFDDTIKIIIKIKEDQGSDKCQRIIQALSSSEQSIKKPNKN